MGEAMEVKLSRQYLGWAKQAGLEYDKREAASWRMANILTQMVDYLVKEQGLKVGVGGNQFDPHGALAMVARDTKRQLSAGTVYRYVRAWRKFSLPKSRMPDATFEDHCRVSDAAFATDEEAKRLVNDAAKKRTELGPRAAPSAERVIKSIKDARRFSAGRTADAAAIEKAAIVIKNDDSLSHAVNALKRVEKANAWEFSSQADAGRRLWESALAAFQATRKFNIKYPAKALSHLYELQELLAEEADRLNAELKKKVKAA